LGKDWVKKPNHNAFSSLSTAWTDGRCAGLPMFLMSFCKLMPSTHRTHLLALSNMLLQPVSIETRLLGKRQLYDPKLLAEVCAQLHTQDLAEVLKYPFCTGEAEQIVLQELETKTDRKFGGDVWKVVEQADAHNK
jgi:hypothetical protein